MMNGVERGYLVRTRATQGLVAILDSVINAPAITIAPRIKIIDFLMWRGERGRSIFT